MPVLSQKNVNHRAVYPNDCIEYLGVFILHTRLLHTGMEKVLTQPSDTSDIDRSCD